MSLEAWIAFCATETVLCFTPGPAVLLVVSVALGSGLRPSIGAALGILAANTMYFALSASSIAVVLLASHELFIVLKWVGAAYLIWLGLRMLLSRGVVDLNPHPKVLARSFLRGLLVQGANPKAIVFFMALLPQFIDQNHSIPVQVAVLGATSIVIEFGALTAYALGAVRMSRVVGNRASRLLERVGGGLLVAVGARLAVARSD